MGFRDHLRRLLSQRAVRESRESGNKRRLFLESLESRQLLATADVDDGPIAAFPGNYYPPSHSLAASTSYLSSPASGSPYNVGLGFLQQNGPALGLSAADVSQAGATNNYADTQGGISHIYLQQNYNGLPVLDAVASVNVMPDGRVLTAGANFVSGLSYPATNTALAPSVTALTAINTLAQGAGLPTDNLTVQSPAAGRNLKSTYVNTQMSSDPIPAQLVYVANPSGGVDLAWEVIIHEPSQMHWFDAAVAASGPRAGQIVRVVDWVDALTNASASSSSAITSGATASAVNGASILGLSGTYNVFPTNVQDPVFGNRALITGAENAVASPFGWHDFNFVSGAESFVTSGNNVYAHPDTALNGPNGGLNLTFNDPFTPFGLPIPNLNAATTNLFFHANIAHDVSYVHGFDEVSGNFQQTNRYLGVGVGNDAVEAVSQYLGPTVALNNAFMATPPDGLSPLLAMGLFNRNFNTGAMIMPFTDADFDSTVVLHESAHGTSNRLTGGPANAGALVALQSGGMGEGWSDWFALVNTMQSTDTAASPRTIGNYIQAESNLGPGLRRYPYSYDMSVDPLTLLNYNGDVIPGINNSEVHNAGEIWSSVLWDITWQLVNKYGHSADLYGHTGGENISLDLVLQGMKLQPANPSFFQARDAIIASDLAMNGGANYELLWQAFARRGFGLSANTGVGGASSFNVRAAFDTPPPLAHVSGTIFNDLNGNQRRDSNESTLAGVTVYDDMNNNGRLDSGEPQTVSQPDGKYSIPFTFAQNVTIRQGLNASLKQTFPANNAPRTLFIAAGQQITGQDFGDLTSPGKITGYKFNDRNGDGIRNFDDLNANGIQDAGESSDEGVSGVIIFVDLNNDGKLSIVEPAAMTDYFGQYTINNVPAGTTLVLRELAPPGGLQTKPGPLGDALLGDISTAIAYSYSNVIVNAGAITSGMDFGNDLRAANDFGDAPDSYGTTLAANGARAGRLAGFGLGAFIDGEVDGQPTADALGDDAVTALGVVPVGLDDEDGVAIAALQRGANTVQVTVSTGGRSSGKLQGWIDFNHNNKFDASEKVVSNMTLGAGTYSIPINVPANTPIGATFARFRYGYENDLGPTGASIAGEVEDYQVFVLLQTPTANDDVFPRDIDLQTQGLLKPSSVNYELDVLANDFGGANTFGQPLHIIGASLTTPSPGGGTLTITTDPVLGREVLLYTPGPGVEGGSVQTFSYQIRDANGNVSNIANVKLNIALANNIAVDDTYTLSAGLGTSTTATGLNVMLNDLTPHPLNDLLNHPQVIAVGTLDLGDDSANPVPPPPINQVTAVYTQPGTNKTATLSIDATNPQLLNFVAEDGFLGTALFKYQIDESPDDPDTGSSTRFVTIQVVQGGPVLASDAQLLAAGYLAELDVSIVGADANGGPTDSPTVVHAGDTFYLRVTGHDLRPVPLGGDPSDRGVQAAYLDLLLNPPPVLVDGVPVPFRQFAAPLPDPDTANPMTSIVFVNGYNAGQNGQNGVTNAPSAGEINEAGALRQGVDGLGTEFQTVFYVRMQAKQATPTGQPLEVKGDPADAAAFRVVVTPTDSSVDPTPVDLTDDQVFLRPTNLVIFNLGEGEFVNVVNSRDVDQDGDVTASDVLTVINTLNAGGARSLVGTTPTGNFVARKMVDVNMDSQLTAMDALMVINYINAFASLAHSSSLVAAAGEGGSSSVAPNVDLNILTPSTTGSTTTTTTTTPTILVTNSPSSTTNSSTTPATTSGSSSSSSSSSTTSTTSSTQIDPAAADDLYAGLAQARTDLKKKFHK